MTLEHLEKLAGIAATLISALALVWSVHEFRASEIESSQVLEATTKRQDDSAAIQIYTEYLKLAFENPTFVFDPVDMKTVPENIKKRYTIFATVTVTIAERLFALSKSDPTWVEVVDSMLMNHHEFIRLNVNCKELSPEFGHYLSGLVKDYHCN